MNGIDKKLLILAALISCFIGISINTGGCADEPSSLGLNYIPPGDTGRVRIFDSYIDTMLITPANYKKLTNTSGSINLMIGKNRNYESKALLQFYNIDTGYSNATVNSASLILKYRNYYFPASQSDSLGQISFDIYKIQKALELSRITLDSVNNTTFGTVSQGNYTGIPTSDTEEVSINLNTVMVKDWLKAASDTGYAVKNYGIVLSPGNSANVIKAFYSGAFGVNPELKPELYIIATRNNNPPDTLRYDATASLSLVNNPSITQTNELFYLQAGIAYIQVLKFDMSKIPSTATINDVQLYLSLDESNSIFSSQTVKEIRASQITDTAGLITENFFYISSLSADNKYVIRLVSNIRVSPFQRWLAGEANYGLYIYPTNIQTNLDLFAFYNTTAAEQTKRPRIVIKYTPRITP